LNVGAAEVEPAHARAASSFCSRADAGLVTEAHIEATGSGTVVAVAGGDTNRSAPESPACLDTSSRVPACPASQSTHTTVVPGEGSGRARLCRQLSHGVRIRAVQPHPLPMWLKFRPLQNYMKLTSADLGDASRLDCVMNKIRCPPISPVYRRSRLARNRDDFEALSGFKFHGRPDLGLSFKPSTPPTAKRLRHVDAKSVVTPSLQANLSGRLTRVSHQGHFRSHDSPVRQRVRVCAMR